MWRALRDLILTAGNLRRQHVPVEGTCTLCHDRWCTSEHCLLFCPKVWGVWKKSSYWPVLKKAHFLQLIDIVAEVREEYRVERYERWVLMLGKIWACVCNVQHEERAVIPMELEFESGVLWDTYQLAKSIFTAEAILGVRLGEKKWKCPKRGRFRVDVDASFRPEQNAFGVGIVIHDYRGRVKVAISRPTRSYSNVMIAETMAIVHGIMASMEHDIAPIEVHTDSILAARLMATSKEEGDLLPEDLHVIMVVARQNILLGVFHMYRSANRVAHGLVQLAIDSPRSMCWTEDFPSWLGDLVSTDIE